VISLLTQLYLSLVLFFGLMKKAILMFVVVLAAAAVLGGLAAVPSTVQNAHANPCSDIEIGSVHTSGSTAETGPVTITCELKGVDMKEPPVTCTTEC